VLDRGRRSTLTRRPLYARGRDSEPTVQEAEWARGHIWTDAGNLAPYRDSIPKTSNPWRVAIPTEPSGPTGLTQNLFWRSGEDKKSLANWRNEDYKGVRKNVTKKKLTRFLRYLRRVLRHTGGGGRRCRTTGSLLYSLDTHTCLYIITNAIQKLFSEHIRCSALVCTFTTCGALVRKRSLHQSSYVRQAPCLRMRRQ
jgi:hypothetical protein